MPRQSYHVEGDDILEGNLAGAMTLNQNLVDDLGTTSSGQTQNEGLVLSWVEFLDATCHGSVDFPVSQFPSSLTY